MENANASQGRKSYRIRNQSGEARREEVQKVARQSFGLGEGRMVSRYLRVIY